MSAPLKRQGDVFVVSLSDQERRVLLDLAQELRDLLTQGDVDADPGLRRLYPPAFVDDAKRSAEFEQMVHEDLAAQRLAAVEDMQEVVEAREATHEQVTGWLSAVNDLRLVLGTRLEVTEETTDKDFAGDAKAAQVFGLYGWLSYLEERIVGELSKGT